MWAAIVKKEPSKKKNGTQDVTGGARGPDRHKDREDRGTESSLDVWKIGTQGNMTFENGRWVDKQQQFRYRNHTNRAGIRQCKRQDGKIAVLLGKKRTYTSRFWTYPRKRDNETDEEFQKRTKEEKEKRLHLLFCPEIVEMTVDPTLSREQRVGRFIKFFAENYPDDFSNADDIAVPRYGLYSEYRELKAGETANNVPKFCTFRPEDRQLGLPGLPGGLPAFVMEFRLDLEVEWVKPGVKISIMENFESGTEYLVTDENFDTV